MGRLSGLPLRGRRLRCGRRRTEALLLLWTRLRGGRRLSAGRCIGGRRALLAGRPRRRRALNRALLAGWPLILIFVVCLGRSALREANFVFYGLRQCRLRARGCKKHRGAKQKGITCHWFLALWMIATRIDIEPRRSVEVEFRAPARRDAPAVRLETITTRQNCGEIHRCRYQSTAHGRFVPAHQSFPAGGAIQGAILRFGSAQSSWRGGAGVHSLSLA